MAQALAFSAAVAAFIWLQPLIGWPAIVLLLAAVALCFQKGSETLDSAGLTGRQFSQAIRNWKIWWAGIAILAVGFLWGPSRAWEGGYRAVIYCAWCIFQQFLYQNMVCKRLRESTGASWKNKFLAGSLFGVVHLPNPVLAPATMVWGTLSGYLFEESPSVYAIGLMQFLLSTCLFWLTPLHWNHGFRVGPGYWHFH